VGVTQRQPKRDSNMFYKVTYKQGSKKIVHENVVTDRQLVDINRRMVERGFTFDTIDEQPRLTESQVTMRGLFGTN